MLLLGVMPRAYIDTLTPPHEPMLQAMVHRKSVKTRGKAIRTNHEFKANSSMPIESRCLKNSVTTRGLVRMSACMSAVGVKRRQICSRLYSGILGQIQCAFVVLMDQGSANRVKTHQCNELEKKRRLLNSRWKCHVFSLACRQGHSCLLYTSDAADGG